MKAPTKTRESGWCGIGCLDRALPARASRRHYVQQCSLRGATMKRLMLAVLVIAAIAFVAVANTDEKEIVAIPPSQVRWFTPSYYTDGRQRAHLLGDSNQEGAWIDRAKIPAGKRVLAHTHSQDEPVTVIEGTWPLGKGRKFNSPNRKA